MVNQHIGASSVILNGSNKRGNDPLKGCSITSSGEVNGSVWLPWIVQGLYMKTSMCTYFDRLSLVPEMLRTPWDLRNIVFIGILQLIFVI